MASSRPGAHEPRVGHSRLGTPASRRHRSAGSPPPGDSHRRERALRVLAVDLDRTLLQPGGQPTPIARQALTEARAMGLQVILVSGRTYPQLRRLSHGFGRFDALVAENGGVVESPIGSRPRIFGRRAAAVVRRRLKGALDLHLEWGRIVVSLPRSERYRALRKLRGVAVGLTPNVDRLMVLPDGVTKATGLRAAVRALGLGAAAYAAIGDAENDLDMLRPAALSGAVANARPVVRSAVDFVSRGRFERGVLEFIEGPVRRRMGLRGS